MAKLAIVKGTTSKLINVFVQDSSVTTGAGLAGLVYNSGSLTGYYIREGDSSATAITLATMTVGTWASGGFKEIDATNAPGLYQLGIPDAALASGAKSVIVYLKGAANMAPVVLEIELTATDNQTQAQYIQSALKKNTALTGFTFVMISSTTNLPATGLTVTAKRSLDGAAFASCANAVSELSDGCYKINLDATDVNGNVVALLFTATGAKPTIIVFPLLP